MQRLLVSTAQKNLLIEATDHSSVASILVACFVMRTLSISFSPSAFVAAGYTGEYAAAATHQNPINYNQPERIPVECGMTISRLSLIISEVIFGAENPHVSYNHKTTMFRVSFQQS